MFPKTGKLMPIWFEWFGWNLCNKIGEWTWLVPIPHQGLSSHVIGENNCKGLLKCIQWISYDRMTEFATTCHEFQIVLQIFIPNFPVLFLSAPSGESAMDFRGDFVVPEGVLLSDFGAGPAPSLPRCWEKTCEKSMKTWKTYGYIYGLNNYIHILRWLSIERSSHLLDQV